MLSKPSGVVVTGSDASVATSTPLGRGDGVMVASSVLSPETSMKLSMTRSEDVEGSPVVVVLVVVVVVLVDTVVDVVDVVVVELPVVVDVVVVVVEVVLPNLLSVAFLETSGF